MTIILQKVSEDDDSESQIGLIIDEVFQKLPQELADEARDKGFMMREHYQQDKTVIDLEVPGGSHELVKAMEKLGKVFEA